MTKAKVVTFELDGKENGDIAVNRYVNGKLVREVAAFRDFKDAVLYRYLLDKTRRAKPAPPAVTNAGEPQ
jgi:hypothetical protein